MKKILIGFLAIGLLTFAGCEKYDDTDTVTTDSTDTSSDDETTDSDDEGKDTDSGDGTTDDSSVEYGEGVTDIDGNTYKSIIIGEQEWMAENLRTPKYSDGITIPNVTNDNEWLDLETGAWRHYDNDNQYDTIYGKLYNWYAVETGKLCPTGWHVPTTKEWSVLVEALKANGHIGYGVGKALKATSGWNDGVNGTDNYGWNGLPGGCLTLNVIEYPTDISFESERLGTSGLWWSSTSNSKSAAVFLSLDVSGLISFNGNPKNMGFSVRCIKD